MSDTEVRRLSTPRSAPVAGIAFALIFATSVALLRSTMPSGLESGSEWLESGSQRLSIALQLFPFAGIAFLWFIGVIRDHLGEYEDRFFSTIFFGSSLLFLAMVFVTAAIAGGILASYRAGLGGEPGDIIINFGRALMLQVSNIYALRMASIIMTTLATIWLRTGLMPRWLAAVTYVLALVLLVVVNFSLWVTLVFPAWVLLISVYTLIVQNRRAQADPV
jgi:hypothetical protein